MANRNTLSPEQAAKVAAELQKSGYRYLDSIPDLTFLTQKLYDYPGDIEDAREQLDDANAIIQKDDLYWGYTINAVGEYKHAYEYIEEEYPDKKNLLYNISWTKERQAEGDNDAVLERDFREDYYTFGFQNPNHKTMPEEFVEFEENSPGEFHPGKTIYDQYQNWTQEVFKTVDDIFIAYIDKQKGLWPAVRNSALKKAGLKPPKPKGRGYGGGTKQSKADKARKQKKKLIDDRNLTQQALLMLELENISKANQDKHRPTGYKNFLCLYDEEPSTIMSRLMSVNFLPINKLKSEHLSALIPEMRFFKVETEIDANGQIDKETGEKEFFFPTFADEDQQKRYNTAITENWKTLISDSKPNIGIKSIDWANRSGNYLLEKSSLQFNVQFYAERLADMFTYVEGYDKGEEFRYSDLFTTPRPYYEDTSNPEQVKKLANENFYRLRAKFGWRVNEGMRDNILSSLTPAEATVVKEGWASLTDQSMVVDLTLVNFDLNFEEDGTTTVNVQYNSFIKQYMSNMDYSNILLSKADLKQLTAKRKKQQELENLKKKKKTPRNKSERKKLSEDLRKINEKLTKLSTNLSGRYSSLVTGLINREAIRVHTVKKKDIIARFQKSSLDSSSGNKKGLDRDSLNIRFEFPEYKEVSFIDLSQAKKSDLYTEIENKDAFAMLKLVRNSITKEERYAYYAPDSRKVTQLPGFSEKLLTEEQIKPFFNGVALSTVPRTTAATEKTKGDQDADRNQTQAKAPVQDTKIPDPSKLNIKNYYEKLDKNAYSSRSGTYNIKYFCLGDLLDVALETFVENTKSAIDLRVILGTVQLKNYPDDVMEGFLDFGIDEKTGLFQITATDEAKKALKKKGVDSKELKNTTATTLRSNAHLYYRNLADIPICFNSFLVWFHDNVVEKSLATLPLDKFIKDVLKLVVTSHNSFGDYAYMIPKQEININRTFSSVPKSPNEEFDYFGLKFRGTELQFVPTMAGGFSSGRMKLDDLRHDRYTILGDQPGGYTNGKLKQPVSLFQSKFKNSSGTSNTNKYMFLFDLPRSLPPHKIAHFVDDSQNGIPHFFIGSSSGLVKSIKFNLIANPLLQADQMLRKPNQTSPKFPIKGRYECDITLVGNNFFTPGMTIYLNPASLRLGNPLDYTSPINSLGIMGYYQIYKMSSYIQSGTYETKITCRFISPGNGLDEHGRLARHSPMGNT